MTDKFCVYCTHYRKGIVAEGWCMRPIGKNIITGKTEKLDKPVVTQRYPRSEDNAACGSEGKYYEQTLISKIIDFIIFPFKK